MANAWRRDHNNNNKSTKHLFLSRNNRVVIFLFSLSLILLLLYLLFFTTTTTTTTSNPTNISHTSETTLQYPHLIKPTFTSTSSPSSSSSSKVRVMVSPFECSKSPQSSPIIANVVEGLKHPFIYSLSDLGSLPDKPHKNIQRILKNKPFRRPDISQTIQDVLGQFQDEGKSGIFVDVGVNVGMASFAAAVMGFQVLGFEPVFENLQRICDGIYFNRLHHLVTLFDAAASDHFGNITFHKLVGRLDNSAVSATGAKLAFKSNQEIAVQVKTIPLDDVIPDSQPVLLLKIDVQGWEYHVLRGAKKLLSRKGGEAPYLIYEEDERLLQASNTTAKEIRDFLGNFGYNHCTQHGTDAHCTKSS